MNFLPYPVLVSEFREGEQHNTFINDNFKDEIGWTLKEIPTLGAWFLKAYPDDEYRNLIISDWSQLVVDARTNCKDFISKKAQIRTKFRGEQWFEVKASLFGPINIVAFVNIDAEIKREIQLEQLNQNKDRTLSILGHDLRAPLVNLQAVLGFVRSNDLTEPEKNLLLTKLTNQVFQMIEFLDTTLHWTRINFSQQQPMLQLVNLQAIVEGVLGLYQNLIHDKKQNIGVTIVIETPPVNDPEIFSITIRNLISNAIKYTPVGGLIQINAKQVQNTIIIEVENSGTAITLATIDSILTKNYASSQGTQGERGLGLGLRLCLQLLESVQGKMEIEVPAQDRTVFRVIIPC